MSNITKRKQVLNYFIKTLNGMALGLFSSLIIGVIIENIGQLVGLNALVELGVMLKGFSGFAIGLGVAWSTGVSGLMLISGALAGALSVSVTGVANPVTIYITTIIAIELLRLLYRLFNGKTPIDILLIPFVTGVVAYIVASLIGEPIGIMMDSIGEFIETATRLQPFLMGIVISVTMGMLLTAPVSSAAIAMSIGLSGIAGGAAQVGCSVQMLGFAIMSRKDNNIGEVISIGIGTSMLQFKNIVRKPIIWLPTIIVSAILGPLSTLVFKAQTTDYGSGMGTSGLVGQIGTLDAMGYTSQAYWTIIILQIILPLILVYVVDLFFRKKKWILPGDLSLKNE